MKFGYFTLTDNSPGYGAQRRDPNQFLLEVAEECVEAEAMGYNSAWVPEHHFARFGVLPSPAMFLAHVAARTKRIKLGPATVVLPLNHPLRVVEEFNLLDVLRSEEHTSELQSRFDLVCRLLLEKKKKRISKNSLETKSL